ncbi:MAG: APC family permease [Erysipelotrichaceae bacterium]|nr:APC family permease [Erysipelotrichaceae bacterium]
MEKENRMEKRYGLPTALSMVVGIVIGSGIFFKAVKLLKLTNGSMKNALLVIGMVGAICIVCSLFFANMGREYVRCNGLVDYAEALIGEKYAYFIGWFMAIFYNPIIGSTLCYISASYVSLLLGKEMYGSTTLGFSILFLSGLTVLNMLSPKLAGKFQVSTAVIKCIPLVLMSIVGIIIGVSNGNCAAALDHMIDSSNGSGILEGVCAFAFSYEGWIASAAINSELKNAKRDLPLALVFGCIFCTLLYMAYVLSMSATLTTEQIVAAGDSLPALAFGNVFGNLFSSIILVFIIISCLGTANGMILCTMRSLYSLGIRGLGPAPKAMADIDKDTGMPLKSCIAGLGLMGFWLFQTSTLFFQGPLVFNGTGNPEWLLAWEADEICIITLYALYVPMFILVMLKKKEYNFIQRYVIPCLALISSLFMCYCCYVSYGFNQVVYYLIFFAIVMAIGMYLMNSEKRKS